MPAGPNPDGDLAPGTSVGQYTIQRRIGSGGMGEVYEAVHIGLNKRVAIKTLRRQFCEHETIVARFLREGQVASRIRHPNVVDVTDVGVIDGLPCLVMEYLEGDSLHTVLKNQPIMPLDKLVDLLLPVLGAVEAAHQVGVVHRDLKPANIFVARTRDGESVPKVLDFGISKLLHEPAPSTLTTDSTFLGSPHYVSPELARGEKDLDGRSDQYAIGVILYEGACGIRPFAHRAETFMSLMYAIAQGDFHPPRHHRPDLPREFEAIVMRAMAIRRESRYPSLRDLARSLLPYASERVRMLLAHSFQSSGVIPASSAEVTFSEGMAASGRPSFEETHGTLGRSASALASKPVAPAARGPVGWAAAGTLAVLAGLGITWAGLTLVATLDRASAGGSEAEIEAVGSSPTQSYVATVIAKPETATLTLDGVMVGTGSMSRTFPVGDALHTLLVSADGHAAKVIQFNHAAPPPARVELEPLPKADATPKPRPAPAAAPRGDKPPPPKTPPPTDEVDPWDGK